MKCWFVSLSICLAACTVELPQGRFACDTDRDCPSAWSCVSGRCYAARADAGSDARVERDGASDSSVEADATSDTGTGMSDAGVDASDAQTPDFDASDSATSMPDANDECEEGFARRGNACVDINECARPAAAAPTTFTALQADSADQASDNDLVATDAWVKLSGDFFVGTWNDQSDLCGADDLTRDAFFQVRTTRTTTLQLKASGEIDTRVVLAVFAVDAPSFTLPERARDADGVRVPCLSGALELEQFVTLSAGSYVVVVKAHARCDLDVTTCVLDGNATQDDAFSLEIRDVDLPTFPCDTNPGATCNNTAGDFTCSCPIGSSGNGEGPNGCL